MGAFCRDSNLGRAEPDRAGFFFWIDRLQERTLVYHIGSAKASPNRNEGRGH